MSTDASPADAPDPNRDRILRGSLPLAVLRFGAPLALAMAFQVLFNLVDQYIIARLPPAVSDPSLDALGICDMVAALGSIVSYGVSTATVALVSRHRGEGDTASASRIAWASVGLTLILGAFFGLVAIVGSDFIVHDLMGAKGHVRALARDYLTVIMGGNVTVFVLFQLTAIQRALGHSRAPLVALVGGNIINLVLAVLLVYGAGDAPRVFSWGPPIAAALHVPRMEVVGAAWATVIARTFACVLPFVMLVRELGIRRHSASLIPSSALARTILSLAWPASAQFVVRTGAVLVMVSLVHHAFTTEHNSDVGTAYALCLRMETMALFVSMGWGGAAQTLIGMCLGADDKARAIRAGWITGAYNVATMLLLAVIYRTEGEHILRFFTERAAIVAIALGYLAVVGPSYIPYGLAIVLGNAMSGAGSTRLTLVIDAVLVLLVQVPLMVLVVGPLHAEPVGLWRALVSVNVLSALVYVVLFRRGDRWISSLPSSAHAPA